MKEWKWRDGKSRIIKYLEKVYCRDKGKIWVNANASEHLGEKVKNYIKRNPMSSPEKIRLVEQIHLESYVGKIEEVTKNGIPLNELKTVEGWGFEFSKSKKDEYPVLIHSQTNQKWKVIIYENK